jgi:endoglucanase
MNRRFRSAVLVALVSALALSAGRDRIAAATGSAAGPVTGPLHTSGASIYDSRGPILLQGVNSDWLDINTEVWPDTPLGDDSIAAMRGWGATIVRVAVGQQLWNADECQHSPTYVSTVDQVVRSITSRGMVALLELHSNTRHRCLPAGQQRMADYPGSVEFWRSVAARYRGNSLVAFDLYNEPHDITWAQWRNGGATIDADGVPWTMAGMQQLYDAVRSTGAQNLVVVSGNGWAASPPPAGYTISGTNIAYAVHSYAHSCPSGTPPLLCPAAVPADPTAPGASLPAWEGFLQENPVLVTEFGWPDPNSGTYNSEVIAWARGHKVGWMAFDWGIGRAYTPAEYGLLATMAPSYSADGSGLPVRQALG